MNRAELVSLMTQYTILLLGLGFQTKSAFGNDDDGFMGTILSWLQYLVYTCVGFNVLFSTGVVLKKAGGFFDSIGQEEMSLDDDIIDILHKGMVPVANAWVAMAGDVDHDRVKHLVAKIRAFKESTNLEYDENFARYFKEEEVYTVYGWMVYAEPEEQAELNWFIRELTEKRFDRQWKMIPPCCGCRERCKNYYRVELELMVRV